MAQPSDGPSTSRSGTGMGPGELAVFAALLVIGAYAWIEAGTFDAAGALWPRILAALLVAVTVLEIAKRSWQARRDRLPEEADPADDGVAAVEQPGAEVNAVGDEPEQSATVALQVAGAFFLFILAGYLVGFLIAAPVFTAIFMIVNGYRRRPGMVAAVCAGLVLTIYVLFDRVINTPLTTGALLRYDLPRFL